jgi:hypothetical protein
MMKKSEILNIIAVAFFGGFVGAISVAIVNHILGFIGASSFLGISPLIITQEWLQNFSWGGAMWGLLAAFLLIIRKKNVYLISLLTMIIAVSFGLFVFQKLPLTYSIKIPYAYLVNLVYAVILAGILKSANLTNK